MNDVNKLAQQMARGTMRATARIIKAKRLRVDKSQYEIIGKAIKNQILSAWGDIKVDLQKSIDAGVSEHWLKYGMNTQCNVWAIAALKEVGILKGTK